MTCIACDPEIMALLASAWDKGAEAGTNDENVIPGHVYAKNPYRKEAE